MIIKTFAYITRGITWIIYLLIILSLAMVAPILLGWKPVVVLSGSMEPAYRVGGLIYYKEAVFEEISIGDGVTFEIGDGSLATHRVVETDTDTQSFITKGDNNDSNDSNPVYFNQVVGKASKICIPYAGYFFSITKNIPVIIFMVMVLIADYLLKTYVENKRQKQECQPENG